MTRPRPARRLSQSVRATSTTLDVVLCLVLLSAAVGVLAAAGPPADDHDPRTASRAATLLASTTVTVEYTPGVDDTASTAGRDVAPSDRRTRVVHGTPAALLARATAVDATGRVDGTETGTAAASANRFADAVADRVRRVLAAVDAHVNVTATAAPVPGSDRRGRVAAGPEVPRDANVAVARVPVPVAVTSTAGGPRPVTIAVRTWST